MVVVVMVMMMLVVVVVVVERETIRSKERHQCTHPRQLLYINLAPPVLFTY